jgi:cytidine deaminase
LVAAVGTDLDRLTIVLTASLHEVNYACEEIRLSELLDEVERPAPLRRDPLDVRYQDYMDAGDDLRRKTRQFDALAVMGIRKVTEKRRERTGQVDVPAARVAYVFRSLKTPEEVETLRSTYGRGFFVISAYSPLQVRRERLAKRIASSYGEKRNQTHEEKAISLIKRDEKDNEHSDGQNVRDSFPLADFFIDMSASDEEVGRKVDRFIELIFGFEFHTPTRDETGMFHARAAALRSAELGRQVGVVIATADGNLVAVGANELPAAGGGLVWAENMPEDKDPRDWKRGRDTNDKKKEENLLEVLARLKANEWLHPTKAAMSNEALLESCLPVMRGTRMMDATEFGRAVHAEMAALTDAASRGVSVRGNTLFTTTFPCHNCARHIISAGISRVVYVEPYAKSLASEFHQEALLVDPPLDDAALKGDFDEKEDLRVRCVPFVGIAPRLYMSVFAMVQRKKNGRAVTWDKKVAVPRATLAPQHLSYFKLETVRAQRLLLAMEAD